MGLLLSIFLFVIITGIFFVPTVAAHYRGKDNRTLILVLNIVAFLFLYIFISLRLPLMLCLTIIGWIILLVWAFSVDMSMLYNPYEYSQSKSILRVNIPQRVCPNCSSKIDEDFSSCPDCGYRFKNKPSVRQNANVEKWICNNCGDKNPMNVRTCNGCGKYR